jgi:hypothetical protein
MRTTAFVAVLVLACPLVARADGFGTIVGGVALPMGDDTWTDTVNSSPTFGLRAGGLGGQLGGMLTVDFTPVDLTASGGSFGFGSATASAWRTRVLAQLVFAHRLARAITISGHAGAGVDIAHASYDLTLLGQHSSHGNTDVGYALEIGAGLWFDLSPTVQLGADVALPIGHHQTKATSPDITFDYTSYDLDLLAGLRFSSR